MQHAFLHRAGVMRNVSATIADSEVRATGINNRTEVVGWATQLAGRQTNAFHYTPTAGAVFLNDTIEPVEAGCRWLSTAHAIANTGHIVGQAFTAGRRTDGRPCIPYSGDVLWHDPFSPDWLPGGDARYVENPYDINDTDVVAMRSWDRDESGVRLSGGVVTLVPPPPDTAVARFTVSGLPGWIGTHARGVNDPGDIAGFADVSRLQPSGEWSWLDASATLWDGVSAHAVDLGVLPTGVDSYAYEVNDHRFVAGYGDKITVSPLPGIPRYRGNAAFIWHRDFGMVALPRLPASGPWGSCEAYAVSNLYWGSSNEEALAQIAGFCTTGPLPGRRRAVRWDVRVVRR
jgi:probable HAF family extracellular repeat protein